MDNVTAGVDADHALGKQIIEHCGGSNLLYAAGHRGTYRQHRLMLAAIGITVISGGLRSQGADRQLLHYGHILARRGVSILVVASNDGAFARLPVETGVTVLTLTPGLVSKRLRTRADAVVALHHPGQPFWATTTDPQGV
ncbi:hypothetical protein [Pedococcus bigeumensis]|uniref:hypothetical protein n=1 Tax=Pedococcus bigeumensis TaxID=433644 RepID=UPI0011283FA7|nr:hypothetical protein [Pedococcus bigeumensis]